MTDFLAEWQQMLKDQTERDSRPFAEVLRELLDTQVIEPSVDEYWILRQGLASLTDPGDHIAERELIKDLVTALGTYAAWDKHRLECPDDICFHHDEVPWGVAREKAIAALSRAKEAGYA